MSGLMGMLSFASRSLDAQRFGLDVVGQNIANVNTEGYSKRVAEFAAVPPPDAWTAGGGVEIDGARSMRDRLIDRRVRAELRRPRNASRPSTTRWASSKWRSGRSGSSLDAALDELLRLVRHSGRHADVPDRPARR